MSQNRYITFLGDPAGKPLRYTFHRAADVRATLFAVFGSYAGTSVLPFEPRPPAPAPAPGAEAAAAQPYTPPTPEEAAIGTFFENVIFAGMWRFIENGRLRSEIGFDLENKCIDTQPDDSTPPTSADDLRRAENAKRFYMFWGSLFAGLTLTGQTISFLAHGMISANMVNRVANDAAVLTRFYTGYQRFNKILSGEWRVTNLPTPEKLAELERGKSRDEPLPVPTPA